MVQAEFLSRLPKTKIGTDGGMVSVRDDIAKLLEAQANGSGDRHWHGRALGHAEAREEAKKGN